MSLLNFYPRQTPSSLGNLTTVTFAGPVSQAAPGATPTINWSLGQKQELILDANVTGITFNPPPGLGNFMLVIKQPSAGGPFTMTGWPANVKWQGGIAPVLTSVNDAIDVLSFYYDGTNYFGQFAPDFQ